MSQDQSEGLSLQCLAVTSVLALISGFIAFSYLKSKKIPSRFRDYSFPSENAEPEVTYGGTSFYARFPKKCTRTTLFGYGPEKHISEIEIELINKDKKTKSQLLLTKDFPYANELINPGDSLSYKWRTREDNFTWSEWSQPRSFVSDPLPFNILPGVASRERCSQIIETIKKGVCFHALVFGKPGAGKSSFLNRLISAIKASLSFVANSAPGHLTTTQNITEYELFEGKAFVSDMFGWETFFGKNAFKLILEGYLRDLSVSQMRKKIFNANDARNAEQTNGENPKIDVAFLVMAATDLDDNLEFHKELIGVLRKLSIPTVGIVTKVDCIVPKDGKQVSLEAFWQDPRVIDLCKKVNFVDMIFPLANPTTSFELKVGVDEIMLQMLRTAQMMSEVDPSKRKHKCDDPVKGDK